jgi:adenylate cyclase
MPTDSESELQLEIVHVLFMDVVGYSKLLLDDQRELQEQLTQIVRNTEQVRLAEATGKLIRVPAGDGMALVFFNSPEAPVQCAIEVSKALKNQSHIHLRMGIHSGPVNEIRDVSDRTNVAGAGINIAQRVMDCGESGHILLSKRVAEDLVHSRKWQAYLHDLGECTVKHNLPVFVVNFYNDEIGNPDLPQKFKQVQEEKAPALGLSGPPPIVRRRGVLIGVGVLVIAGFALGIWFHSRNQTTSGLDTEIGSRLAESIKAKVGAEIQSRLGESLKGKAATSVSPSRATMTVVPPADQKSIAVLPFVDLSQAHDQEYFCDGISEEILDALAKVEGLRVVARTSSFSFKGKNADVSEIAQKLNVQNVLEGSLRREGNRVRITAQLVDAHDGFHVWSDTFERELQGVFAVQDEITRSIVDALKVKLAVVPSERAPENTEAHDLYLQGLYLSNKSDEENLRKSLALFQRALDKDPNFARAWTGIAKSWLWLADAYVRPLEAYPKVKEAALKALSLDQRDAEAHCYLGETKRILDRDLAGEEAELKRALEIDPNSAPAHLFMALLKSSQGELGEGIRQIQEAEKLDPLAPVICSFAVGIYLAADRIDDAIEAGKRTLQVDPNYVYFDPALADAYREKADFEKALALYEKAETTRNFPSAGLAITYAKMGRREDARRILEQLVDKSRQQYVAADSIATVYAALGEKDEAFRWLERAVDEHSAPAANFVFHPEFRAFRSDPRFTALVSRIGIDPSKVAGRQALPGETGNRR